MLFFADFLSQNLFKVWARVGNKRFGMECQTQNAANGSVIARAMGKFGNAADLPQSRFECPPRKDFEQVLRPAAGDSQPRPDRPDTLTRPVRSSACSAMPNRTVFFVSDGTGITAETFGKAILAQFDIAPR
ncbi:MAG: hypothetical protein Q4D74_04340, partial [Comamonadaceae bacterium]|nr:hypothetical protein [Comamonadaceae bacterium]